MGKGVYGDAAEELLITADCGGSNGCRVRLWKYEVQKFSNKSGLKIHIRHFPPGTSKWNKIEHRLFSYISKNWRGKPLISREAVVNLIGSTKTEAGLTVMAVLGEPRPEGRGMIWKGLRTPPKCSFELPGPKGPGFLFPG